MLDTVLDTGDKSIEEKGQKFMPSWSLCSNVKHTFYINSCITSRHLHGRHNGKCKYG